MGRHYQVISVPLGTGPCWCPVGHPCWTQSGARWLARRAEARAWRAGEQVACMVADLRGGWAL